jgi:DNA gyrase inhibitor GyrI
MENQEVRIVTLPPLRVASFYVYSEYPEIEGWSKLVTWAKAHGMWKTPPETRIFGFDNPGSSEGSPNRGYELWLTVEREVQADEQIKIKEFPGGLYGVLRCDVTTADPFEIIPATWQELVRWLETSHYKLGKHQCLEEHLTHNEIGGQNFILDLYLPIVE